MAVQFTQYFNVKVSSPTASTSKKASTDITNHIQTGCVFTDEDGKLKTVTFDMVNAYLWIDIIFIGMELELIGGDLTKSEYLFKGYITKCEPTWQEDGDTQLAIEAVSDDGKVLALNPKNLVFPSKNHPKTWAREELLASDIMINIAEDAGFKKGTINVYQDAKYTFKKPVSQSNKTDWNFIMDIAAKINCVVWTDRVEGQDRINIVDESVQVNKLANISLFYPSRIADRQFIDIVPTDSILQMIKVSLTLDTNKGKKGAITVGTNPETGEPEYTKEELGEDGWHRWVLNQDMVRKLSPEKRRELIELFTSGQTAWESDPNTGVVGVKDYFIEIKSTDKSSREAENSNYEIHDIKGNPNADGVTSDSEDVRNEGSGSFKTVVDDKALAKLNAEERSAVMGRIARKEITEADKKLFTVVETKPPLAQEDQEIAKAEKVDSGTTKDKKKRRDAGFKIEAEINGDLRIKTKVSYVLEGLSKYSGTYYLYRLQHVWGERGFLTRLTFVK